MSSRTLSDGLSIALVAAAASFAPASVVSFVSQVRYVDAYSIGDDPDPQAATGFGPFSGYSHGSTPGSMGGNFGLGTQISHLGDADITARGHASAGASTGFLYTAYADSLHTVVFDLATEQSLILFGQVETITSGPLNNAVAAARLLLQRSDGLVVLDTDVDGHVFDITGMIGPGRYTLSASASAAVNPTAPSSADARFDFTMYVPSPGAGLMFAGGLACLLGARRRPNERRARLT